ncbi:hypothetical protein JNW87_25355, partial [Micromonospora sp. ATA51]|nr:hypothetical protein [Micromonospora sp. ATA51]
MATMGSAGGAGLGVREVARGLGVRLAGIRVAAASDGVVGATVTGTAGLLGCAAVVAEA